MAKNVFHPVGEHRAKQAVDGKTEDNPRGCADECDCARLPTEHGCAAPRAPGGTPNSVVLCATL